MATQTKTQTKTERKAGDLVPANPFTDSAVLNARIESLKSEFDQSHTPTKAEASVADAELLRQNMASDAFIEAQAKLMGADPAEVKKMLEASVKTIEAGESDRLTTAQRLACYVLETLTGELWDYVINQAGLIWSGVGYNYKKSGATQAQNLKLTMLTDAKARPIAYTDWEHIFRVGASPTGGNIRGGTAHSNWSAQKWNKPAKPHDDDAE